MKDKFGKQLVNVSIIDVEQTINGENIFVMLNVSTLDLRYKHDMLFCYQYDVLELLEEEYEIIGNIYVDIRKEKISKLLQ